MGRLTYFFLQTALFFAAGIILLDYLLLPLPASIMLVGGIVLAFAGVGEANSGRHR